MNITFRKSSLSFATLLSLFIPFNVNAQIEGGQHQLPNWQFEEDWVTCTPYTSSSRSHSVGTTPNNWMVSNVAGYYLITWIGATTVGSQVDGVEGKAVKVTNGSAIGNTIPGYFTLGTTWNTSNLSQNNKDGGSFGGYEFNSRPDAISFFYKSEGSIEPTVLAYLWSGTYTQADVPCEISNNATKITMVNRDRNIIGYPTDQGGEVDSLSQNGHNIAILYSRLDAAVSDWTHKTFEIGYQPDDNSTPEWINVVFSADDYFSSSPTSGNSITVDNVKLIYFSRLASLSVKSVPIDGFDSDTYSYTIDTYMPRGLQASDVVGTLLGGGQSAIVEQPVIDEANAIITIKVQGIDWDIDDLTEHTYTIQYKKRPVTDIVSITIPDGEETTISAPTEGQATSNEAKKWVDFNGSSWTIEKDNATVVEFDESLSDKQSGKMVLKATNTDALDISPKYYVIQFYPFAIDLKQVALSGAGGQTKTVYIRGEESKASFVYEEEMSQKDTYTEGTDYRLSPYSGTITLESTEWNLDDPNDPKFTLRLKNEYEEKSYTVSFSGADDLRSSRLSSISIDGTPIENFNSKTFEYIINGQLAEETEITADAFNESPYISDGISIGEAVKNYENATATITVSNEEGPDYDGELTHTYTLQFELPYYSRIKKLTIDGTDIEFDSELKATVNVYQPVSAEELNKLISDGITLMQGSGNPTWTASYDPATSASATITVSNTGADIDGKTSHAYTLTFLQRPDPVLTSINVNGTEILEANKFNYEIASLMPASDKINVTYDTTGDILQLTGPTVDSEKATASYILTNGIKTNTYKITFLKPTNSRLASISVNGTMVANFSSTVYDYDLTDIEMPEEGSVTFTFVSSPNEASANIVYDMLNNKVTITVTGQTPDETDGKLEHIYTLTFKTPSTDEPGDDNDPNNPENPDDPSKDPNTPDTPDNPTVPDGATLTVYDGTLTIEMMGEDITGGGQSAKVEIEEYEDGTATFRLPNFELDLGEGPMPLGDIVVENVTVTEDNGIRTYKGEVKGFELADGEIVADVELDGTVDANLFAHMMITVFWEGIEIDVEFNGQGEVQTPPSTDNPNDPNNPDDPNQPDGEWTEYDGILTVDMNGYDITEGGKDAKLSYTVNEDGTYDFLLPDFSFALDSDNDNVDFGNILVRNVDITEIEGITSFNGFPQQMEFSNGIKAEISVHGTLDPNGDIRVFIDVIWEAEDGRRIPLIVKFVNNTNEFSEYRISYYRGILTTKIDGEIPIAHNVYVAITPESKGRVSMDIEGMNFPTFSRASAATSTITVPGVFIGKLSNGQLSYDGAGSGIAIQDGVTVDMTMHGHTLSDGTLLLTMKMDWAEGGARMNGDFNGTGTFSDINNPAEDTTDDDGNWEYYDLKGLRVNPDTLRPGIYIRRNATRTEKILINQ